MNMMDSAFSRFTFFSFHDFSSFGSRRRSFLDGSDSGSEQNVLTAPAPVEMCRLRRLRLRIPEEKHSEVSLIVLLISIRFRVGAIFATSGIKDSL